MKKDLKAHPVTNIITFIGIFAALFMISYCMLFGEKYRSFDKKQSEAFSLTCLVKTVEKEITEEQAENALRGYEQIARDHLLKYASIENLGGQEILTSHDIKHGIDKLSADSVANVRKLINNGELCFVMRNGESLQEAYQELTDICSENGFEICVADHKEINERHTAVIEKRLYILIRCGSMLFSALILLILVFLWFDKRKHEWFIRNICGQSVKELLMESTKILLSMIVVAYSIVSLVLSIYKPASVINIIEYGCIGFVEAIICLVLFSIKYSNIKR